MKKAMVLVLLMLSLTGCSPSKEELRQEIHRLELKHDSIVFSIQEGNDIIDTQKETIKKLDEDIKVLGYIKEGKQPKYILTLRLKQSHFTLDLTQHLSDSINAVEFDIPVDKEYYDKVIVGSEIVDEFRMGSLVLKSSIGSWDMRVKDKKII